MLIFDIIKDICIRDGSGQIFGPGAPSPKPAPVPGAPNIFKAYLASRSKLLIYRR